MVGIIKYDGDTVSIRPRWSKEANADAERLINSNAYILNMQGECMRKISKDFLITQYVMSKEGNTLSDVNVKPPKFNLAA